MMYSGDQPVSAADFRAQQFLSWEQRGRGLHLWDARVELEPPFVGFSGHKLPAAILIDDGREPTVFSSLADRIKGFIGRGESSTIPDESKIDGPGPRYVTALPDLVELQIALPADFTVSREAFELLLSSLTYCREPLCFELLGLPDQIIAQFAVHTKDAATVTRQFNASFPEAVLTRQERFLEQAWNDMEAAETAIVEFGLEREFMFSLATVRNFNQDPLIGLAGALSGLEPHELALFQVLFQPVSHPWAESMVNSVSDHAGKPFFPHAPELLDAARNKAARPLYAVVVRIATLGQDWARTWDIARDLAAALRVFAAPQGNEFSPLPNNGYVVTEHAEDVISRQTRRSGMLLNRDELISFVHLPSTSVRSPKLKRTVRKTKAAPKLASSGTLLGYNTHAGQTQPVYLSSDQRFRHVHVLGTTGTGKSTLLFNLIRQDIEAGQGVAVLDPHGDLIDRLLTIIPPERMEDVILFDPSDPEFTVGFNLLSAHSEAEKALLASDLVSVFERHSTSWGDQMNSVLRNAVLAFLESSRGGTLLDLRRFLLEPGFRADFLSTITDSEVLYYWQKAFPQLTGTKSLGPILTRLDTFLSPKTIRHALALQHTKLDFAQVMDSGKIFLAKLPQGLIGKADSYLLGSLLVGKFQQLAMARQGLPESQRRPVFLYIDEFHQFMTPSMTEILNGARKYRLGLTLAHQELRQLSADKDVESAVLANAGTRIVFRVGDADARQLAEGFAGFEAADLSNLETGQAICRLERSDHDFNLRVIPSVSPCEAQRVRETVIARSREQFATPRTEIEALLRQQLTVTTPFKPEKPKPAKPAEPKPVVELPITPAEVTPETSSEKKSPPSLPPTEEVKLTSPASSPSLSPRDLGRGGAQHQTIQKRLKEAAEKLGYLVTIEKPVLDRTGSVDLALESTNRNIAVEITVTTTIDHEVGNVLKGLKAGFQTVAVVSGSETKLTQMREAVTSALGSVGSANVGHFTPDQFIEHLQKLAQVDAPSASPSTSQRRGFKVTRSAPKLTAGERETKEAAALRMLADSMKRKA